MVHDFMDELVRRLTPQEKCTTITPELVILEWCSTACDFSVDALADMLWLRWKGRGGERGRLESFVLEISKEFEWSVTRDKVCAAEIERDSLLLRKPRIALLSQPNAPNFAQVPSLRDDQLLA